VEQQGCHSRSMQEVSTSDWLSLGVLIAHGLQECGLYWEADTIASFYSILLSVPCSVQSKAGSVYYSLASLKGSYFLFGSNAVRFLRLQTRFSNESCFLAVV
jgi:hypothetical protein